MKDALADAQRRRIVGISGLGGTGKTSVAIEVARSFRELGFQKIVWQTASSTSVRENLPGSRMTFSKVLDEIAKQLSRRDLLALQGEEREIKTRELLYNERVLLVLDNMETSGEPQEKIAGKLLPILGNSKLLLTSRHRFETIEIDIFDYHIVGLGKEPGIKLMRQTAHERNIAVLQESDLEPLIDLTGNERMGYSPLAIKFIVGQRGHRERDEISRNLENIRLPQNDEEVSDKNLFRQFWHHIFSESYQLLEEPDQTLLSILALLDPSQGTSHDVICKMLNSELTQQEIEGAINHTRYLSFLEVEREKGMNQQLYSMHLLTNRYFAKIINKYSQK
ncbi:MAG: NB-ARC domain-containing protein [Gloeotrichia echinulata DVL01]